MKDAFTVYCKGIETLTWCIANLQNESSSMLFGMRVAKAIIVELDYDEPE